MKNETGKRKWRILVVAAMLTFALVVVASAAMHNQGSVDILSYLGLGDADTSELGDGIVAIDCSDECAVINRLTSEREIVEMTAVSSIGDKRNVFVKFETNIEAPEAFDPEQDYFMADEWICEINKEGNRLPSQWGGMLEGCVEEGKLCFYMSIEDCKDINKSTVNVTLGDIYLHHDKGVSEEGKYLEEELVYEGSWEFSWTYDYKAAERRVGINKFMNIEGYKCYVRDVQITPLEVKVRAWTLNDRKTGTCLSVDAIVLKDGTMIRTIDAGGGERGSTMLPIIDHVEGYANVAWLGHVLDPSTVEGIVVDDVAIGL